MPKIKNTGSCTKKSCYRETNIMTDSNGKPTSARDSTILAKYQQKMAKNAAFIAKRTAQNAKYNSKIPNFNLKKK